MVKPQRLHKIFDIMLSQSFGEGYVVASGLTTFPSSLDHLQTNEISPHQHTCNQPQHENCHNLVGPFTEVDPSQSPTASAV